MHVTGARRKYAALAGLAAIAALAWFTMDPGKIRLLVVILLGGFAARIALTVVAKHNEPVEENDSSL